MEKKLQKLWPFQCWRRLRDDHLKAADLVITECHYFQKFINAKQEKTAVVYWPKEVPEGWKMEAPENEAPENQVPVLESQTASENADINVGVKTQQ